MGLSLLSQQAELVTVRVGDYVQVLSWLDEVPDHPPSEYLDSCQCCQHVWRRQVHVHPRLAGLLLRDTLEIDCEAAEQGLEGEVLVPGLTPLDSQQRRIERLCPLDVGNVYADVSQRSDRVIVFAQGVSSQHAARRCVGLSHYEPR